MSRAKARLLFPVLLILDILSPQAHTQDLLSEEALFYRCYAHLTQLRPTRSDTLLAQVKAGSKTAVQACTEVLDQARFSADNGTKIQDDNDPVARAVLYSLHQLHRSWSREKTLFNPTDGNTLVGSETWYDNNPMGAYITRALFSPNYNVDSVTQGSDYLQPIRETMSPTPSYLNVPGASTTSARDWRLGANHPFAPRGGLLGIRSIGIAPISFLPPTPFVDLTSMPDFANIGVAPITTQAFANINFPDVAPLSAPLAGITTQFAIRIRGQIQIPSTDTYTLFLSVDDGGRLIIDGNPVLDRTSPGESSFTGALSAGNHALEVQYRQRTNTARLIFSWQAPWFPKQVVPASALTGLQAEYYTESQSPAIRLTGHEGGGFIGNHNYFITTFVEADRNFIPNGALLTNRSWARAVIKDTLNREIPVVREVDAQQFVIPESTTPFREYAACSTCHATVDRAAGVIRNFGWNPLTSIAVDTNVPPLSLYGILAMNMRAPSLAEDTSWSDVTDTNYSKRPPYGHFYFRNYRGELVDSVVRSIEELGATIRDQDDYYTCFAERYYQYFFGIDVELGDPGDVTYPQLNAAETYHRAKVIDLGSRLKTHKSLRQLILDIIGSPEYRMSDYGISYRG